MHPKKIGYIGLGLIGGSIAKTIHRIYPEVEQIAYKPHAEDLQDAVDDGVLSYRCDEVGDAFQTCDLIFLCAPVLTNNEYLPRLNDLANGNMLVTDVGSVKTTIHNAVREYPALERHFIGGHPMCGTEKTGYENATAYMLENAYYMLTPTATVPDTLVSGFESFVRSIGALPFILDYQKHDFSVGSISHLPTVIASTLVNLVRDLDDDGETLRTIAAGGFRDITRVASSDPTMWENICVANRDQILDLIDSYTAAMQRTRETIAGGSEEEILDFFGSAKEYRDSFHISNGALHPIYQLFLDLIDEAGGIATVATILATNGISIKNIGIIHNREFQQGVLQVEFYDQPAFEEARELLKRHHYNVYE